MIAPILSRLLRPEPLTVHEARGVFDALLGSERSEGERCALLVALTTRAPHAREWTALAGEMRRRSRPFRPRGAHRAVDLCGSGGAPKPSFNVSTVAAFVVAASGTPVIKHGNRSARGPTGSSDLLTALGLPVTTSVAFAEASFRKYGIAFLHAPLFHPATAAMASARQLLGIPTVFNRLGPLSNPAHVPFQVVGWGDRTQGRIVVEALRLLGVRRAVTMTSGEGCDEFSPAGPTYLTTWDGRRVRSLTVRPATYLPSEDRRGPWGPLAPGLAAEETERILAGGGGARRGSILLTAGAALWVSRTAPSFAAGVDRSREVLDSGSAERLLRDLRRLAPRFARGKGG
ncbi:MAG: anthranilate phosphoribosyltransferase [Thermoplasmata archaeon]|nr:anthranilate phosphoribosyltransferase [Thermoplasmata archaeon]